MFTCPYCGKKYPDTLIEKVARERRREILCPYCGNHSEVSLRGQPKEEEYEYINIAEFLMPYLKIAIPIVFIIVIATFLLFADGNDTLEKKEQTSLFEMETFFGWWENKESMEVLDFLFDMNTSSNVGSNPDEPTYILVKKSCKNGIRAGVTNISNKPYVTYQTTDAGLFFVDANTFFTDGIINASLTEDDVSDYSVNWKYAYNNVSKWFSIYEDYQSSGKAYDGTFGYPKILQ